MNSTSRTNKPRSRAESQRLFWQWILISLVTVGTLLTLYGVHTGYLEFHWPRYRPYHAEGFDSQGNTYYRYDDEGRR